MAEINETPSGMRTHIGFFGKTNTGKSTLINALVGQDVSIVSPEPGTTTDPVYKAIEIAPIGPCLLIDTAGLQDETVLGSVREAKTRQVAEMCDVAILVGDTEAADVDATDSGAAPVDGGADRTLLSFFEERKVPVIRVCTGIESKKQESGAGAEVVAVDALSGTGVDELRQAIVRAAQAIPEPTILGDLVSEGDLVLLVMPQDKQAPKGRLILPQVTTLRELLDKHARSMCVAPEEMESALAVLKEPPALIITDSQVFDYVAERTPKESRLTSFSVLYARLKGDLDVFVKGAYAIDTLKPGARVLVAESCSHAPLEEDIGRVKLPAMIGKRIGGDVSTEIVAGKDFPEDLTSYDLILQCGGCMVNRRQIMNRVLQAASQGVPITNYGVAIAYMKGILEKVLDKPDHI